MSLPEGFSDTGAFRGVPFFVSAHDVQGGQRLVRNEYPLRDLPSTQHLGRKARTYTLTLYVIGEKFLSDADALASALEAPGDGELLHPWLGLLRVGVDTYRREDSTAQGGLTRFQVTFAEGAEVVEPAATRDTRHTSRSTAAATMEAASAVLVAEHQPAGQPAWSLQRLVDGVSAASAALRAQASASLDLIRQPLALGEQLFAEVDALTRQAQSGFGLAALLDRVRSLGDLISVDAASTPTLSTMAASQTAIARHLRVGVLAAAARRSADLTYRSQPEARALRAAFSALQDAELQRPASAGLYGVLVDLRAAVVRDLDARGLRLPDVRAYVPPATTPMLVIAHRLYGDATRCTEIAERNGVVDIGFVPGGQALEVLSR